MNTARPSTFPKGHDGAFAPDPARPPGPRGFGTIVLAAAVAMVALLWPAGIALLFGHHRLAAALAIAMVGLACVLLIAGAVLRGASRG